MNVFTGYGRVVKEVEVKTLSSGTKIANFTMAIPRPFKNASGEYESDFIPCTVFNENVINVLSRFVGKGNRLTINGSLQITNTQQNGEWKNYTTVIVNSISLVETRAEQQQGQNQGQGQQTQQRQTQATPKAREFDESNMPF